MAELLILVVVAGVVLLYAVDRARKLRARARQMSAMNQRLDVAAARVDEQQERKQARVRASAELTSVMPAIKRPPLTLPGSAAGPAEEPAAAEPEAGPAAEAAAEDTPATAARTPRPAGETPVVTDDTPARADPGNTPDGAGADESPSAQPPDVVPDATPAPKLQTTSDGTSIMPPVPGQGPAPAGETARSPASSRARPRASRPRTGQPRTGQPRAPQPRASQPRAGQQSTSQEQANRD
jgi:type II secretory pathway pseudopilin PulG